MSITQQDVDNAQEAWAQGVIAIGVSHQNNQNYTELAKQFLQTAYSFDHPEQPLLFKPTRAAAVPFRDNLKGTLSYFIGGDTDFQEDKGFALEPWKTISFDNTNIFYYDDIAIAMGHYTLTSMSGNTATLEYSFGFVKDDNDEIKIFLHHSSVPFSEGA